MIEVEIKGAAGMGPVKYLSPRARTI